MANTCGECLLFQGSGKKCDADKTTSSANQMAKSCGSFKAPASYFDNDRCGGCRLFEGASNKCGQNRSTSSSNGMAKSCPSYAPIPG